MRRTIFTLAIAGALLLPASALGATVSPEKQAFMDRQGWTATDEDSETAYPLGAGPTGDCNGRARRAASALRYKSGNPMVRGSVKLALCANNGHITAHQAQYAHASPGRDWKSSGIGADTWSEWTWPNDNTSFQAHAVYYWTYLDTPWSLRIKVKGWVKRGTDHRLKFATVRRWQ